MHPAVGDQCRPAPGEELTPSDNSDDEFQNRTPASFWITIPNNTIEEGVLFYLLSAVEAQPGHRVSNHQLRDQVSSLKAHLPWELDRARLNVLI